RNEGPLEDQDYEDIGRAWRSVGKHGDVFTYPNSKSDSLEGIAKDMSRGSVTAEQTIVTPFVRNNIFNRKNPEVERTLDAYGISRFKPTSSYKLSLNLTPEQATQMGIHPGSLFGTAPEDGLPAPK